MLASPRHFLAGPMRAQTVDGRLRTQTAQELHTQTVHYRLRTRSLKKRLLEVEFQTTL